MTPSSNPAICYFSQKELKKNWIDFYQGDSTWLTHDEHPFRRPGTWQNIHQTLSELTVKSIRKDDVPQNKATSDTVSHSNWARIRETIVARTKGGD